MTTYVLRNGMLVDKSTGQPTPDVSNGILTPQILSDLPAYFSVVSNKWIEGRSARRDDLARTGCREVDPSEGPKVAHTKRWAERLKLDYEPPKPKPRITRIGPEV